MLYHSHGARICIVCTCMQSGAYVGYENMRQEVMKRRDAELEEKDAEDEAQPYLVQSHYILYLRVIITEWL